MELIRKWNKIPLVKRILMGLVVGAVLGVAILNTDNGYNLAESTFNGCCAALGFTLAMTLFACIREKLSLAKMPKWMDGFPGALITAGLMAVAFQGFGGLI